MTPRNVGLVLRKEIRDTLRDRRTLFISVVLPIFLYPLLMIGGSQIIAAGRSGIWDKPQQVAIVGIEGEALEKLTARLTASEGKLEVASPEDPESALAAEEIHAYLTVPAGFDADLAEGRQGEVTLHFDSAKDGSQAAARKIQAVFTAFADEVLRERGLTDADIDPVKVTSADTASTSQRGAKVAGPLLAMLLVIMAASGAFYPAIDIMAGEKERGTMETLLVCPATRTEIVLGKFLTVLVMTLATALLNFASMALTFAHMVHLIPKARGTQIALDISPAVAFVIILALIPLAGLFSAVSLALSTFARSYKEGQHYLTPLFLIVMPLGMVALIPGTRLESFALVPVAGLVLLVRDLLLEAAPMGQVLTVLVSSAVYAAAAIYATVKMFNREDVLFRDPGGADFSPLVRARRPGETPKAGQAFVLAGAVMVLVYFVPPLLFKAEQYPVGFLLQFLGILLAVPIGAAAVYRLDIKKTFSLKLPPHGAWPLTLAGAPALLVIVMSLMSEIGVDEESLKPLAEEFQKILDAIGLPLLIILPPIAEEFLFRGFILSGFRRSGKVTQAVLLSAAMFAVFHFVPAKFLPTGLIGVWLAYLVVATGSLYPAILAHLLNNGIAVLYPFEPTPLRTALAVVVLATVVVLLEMVRRGNKEGSPDPTFGR